MLYMPRIEVFTEMWEDDLHRDWMRELEDEMRRHDRALADIRVKYQRRLARFKEWSRYVSG
jgi:hypothetical protein